MGRSIPVLLALLFAGSTAVAAEPPARGFYVGANAGVTSFDDDTTVGSTGIGPKSSEAVT